MKTRKEIQQRIAEKYADYETANKHQQSKISSEIHLLEQVLLILDLGYDEKNLKKVKLEVDDNFKKWKKRKEIYSYLFSKKF
jgi:hypothetical protein